MKATLVATRIVQSFLKSDGTYLGLVDNDWGPKSQDAARRFASKLPKYHPAWDNARCRVAVEQFIIKQAGIDVGVFATDMGFYGLWTDNRGYGMLEAMRGAGDGPEPLGQYSPPPPLVALGSGEGGAL